MGKGTDNRRGLSWYISADRPACAAVSFLLLIVCVGSGALAALAAPTIETLIESTRPQPTPTITSSRPGVDLSLLKPVTVSADIAGFPASFAVDANPDNWWSSGAHAPQWIEIDLEADYVISQVRLLPSQSPSGNTVHRVLVKGTYTQGRYLLVHTFEEFTRDRQWLIFKLPEPIRGVRFVRIESTSSPSWIGWREVHVISGE